MLLKCVPHVQHDYFSSFNQSDHCFLVLSLSLPSSLLKFPFKKLRRQLQGKRHIKIELCGKLSLLRLFHVDYVVQNRRGALSLAWHECFSYKGKEWKIYCCELPLSSEPQIWKFHVVIWQTTSKHCTKKRAARAARLFSVLRSTNQIFDLWRCRCRLSFLNYLMFRTRLQTKYVKMKNAHAMQGVQHALKFFLGWLDNYANTWSHLCRRPSSWRKLALLFWRQQH